jgi:transcription initiation factor TFIIB
VEIRVSTLLAIKKRALIRVISYDSYFYSYFWGFWLETKVESRLGCSECGGVNLLRDHESGELVCRDCGYVVSSTILDRGRDWRAFDPEQNDKLTRVGAPSTWTIHDKGLSTTIGWQDIDATGRRLGPDERARLYRLRRWQRRSKVSGSFQRNLAQALGEIGKVSYSLSLPRNVVETASVIYRRAVKEQLIKGRAIKSIAIACVYMACRQCSVLRSLGDVADASGISRNEAAKNYRFLVKALSAYVPQVSPKGYISKIVNRLRLRGEAERLALRVLEVASDLKLTCGRGPSGMAAACVYISCQLLGERRTQGEISKVAQVTEVTIRNRYRELAQRLTFSVGI